MRVLTTTELLRMTCELCNLMARITNALLDFPKGSDAEQNARTTLRRIRRILAQRAAAPS